MAGRAPREERAPRASPLRQVTRFLGPPEEQWEWLLLLAIAVGLASGVSAVLLRSSVHALFEALEPLRERPLLATLLPAVGAGAGVAIVALLFREPPGHGVPQVIRAVCRVGGEMRRRSMLSRWLGSLVHVSAGGSAGLEGPIVFSAAAIGSTIGGRARLDERRRSVLLACGVAGGISGVFNAPMTGMIFAMEVVLAEWSAFSIIPVVVAAVSATELARLALGDTQPFLHAPFAMGTSDLVACIALGIACGFCSTLLTRGVRLAGALGARVAGGPFGGRFGAPLLAGLFVGLIGLAWPGAIGEGYETANAAIGSRLEQGLGLCLGLAAAKLVATSLSLGSGAPGGVFAPSLVLGSLVGVSFHRLARALLPGGSLPGAEGSYALVGMAGLVAGVMQAPLTGIFLVMEVTDGYDVILPLMIVAVLSLLVARHFDRYSLYTAELARTGELLRPGTDRRILADLRVGEALDRDVTPIDEDLSLADFVRVLKRSRRNHFPVLRSGTQELAGMLELGPLREILLDPELSRVTLVGTMMDSDTPVLAVEDSLADALRVFESTGAWVLPVVDGERFAGLLSKSTLFDHYRRELSVQTPH